MAKGKERSNQDVEKVPTASEVLASAAAALTSSAAALTSAATALTSAADAITSYASISKTDSEVIVSALKSATAYSSSSSSSSSSNNGSDDDQADLHCENNPTKEGVLKLFREFKARRDGIVKALTTDVENFHKSCNPDDEGLCLYGLLDGSWNVTPPVELVPPDKPEQTVGFNFIRDSLNRKAWLADVAMHSDAWLYQITFFKRHNLEDKSRRELFNMINNLPTIYELVMEAAKKPSNESTPEKSSKCNKSASEQMAPAKRPPKV